MNTTHTDGAERIKYLRQRMFYESGALPVTIIAECFEKKNIVIKYSFKVTLFAL